MPNNIVVVIPTYNERDNIEKLITDINKLGLPADILVVDDNSPDGTGDLVEAIKKNVSNLDIMHRKEKEGLGCAYIDAFMYILKKEQYDFVIQMDADFSHDPKYIPELLDAAGRYDVVIGSRYTEGGGVSDQWSVFRKALSRLGNMYTRFIARINAKDCTSGFRCWRKEALRSIDLNKKFLNGYGFLPQMLYELDKNKFTIYESPIFFEDRTKEATKFNLRMAIKDIFISILIKFEDVFFKGRRG